MNDHPITETILKDCPIEVRQFGSDVALTLTTEKLAVLLNPMTALSVAYSLFGAALDQLPPGYVSLLLLACDDKRAVSPLHSR